MTDAEPAHGLARRLGLAEVTAGGIGIIVGAGIYVLLGEATALAGPLVWISFLVAAALSVLTGLSYAELAAMFPKAGAEYEYTRSVLPEWIAVLVGWTMLAGLTIAAATVSLGFARYLGNFVTVEPRLVSTALLCVVAAVVSAGVKEAARVTMLLSGVQIAGLLLVLGIGIPHFGQVDLTAGSNVGGILSGAALVFFAFIGFDEVTTLAEETRDPTRNVPRALFLALGISSLLYVGVALSALGVLGAEALSESPRPLADVIAHALGPAGATVVAIVAMLSTANVTLMAITAASRVMYGMGARGALASSLGLVSTRTRTPLRAILVCILIAWSFSLIGDLALIAAITDFAVYLVFLAVNGTVVLLRLRQPETPRPFRIPGSIARVPVVPVLGFLSVLVMMAHLERRAVALGLVLSALGAVAAWRLHGHRRGAEPAAPETAGS